MISRGFFAYVLLSFVRISMGTQCGIGQRYSEVHKVASATVKCTGACDCNIAASGVSGRITDGQGTYSRSSWCRWEIKSNVKPAEIIINRKPGSVFEMEGFDSIEVWDDYDYVAYYSRTDPPSTLTTHTGNVLVTFYSDSSGEKEGFELEWGLQTTNGCIACEDCVYCQAGKYKENTGPASDWEECVNCQAGKYKGNTGPGTCTNCEHGKYGDINVTGATTSDVCNPCPVNTYTTHKGSTSCTLCSTAYDAGMLTAYDAGMLTDAFNNDRDHFGCIAFVLT